MSEEKRQQIDLMVRFFNMHSGRSFKCSVKENRYAVYAALARGQKVCLTEQEAIIGLKNYVRVWCEYHKNEQPLSLFDCFNSFCSNQNLEKEELDEFEEFYKEKLEEPEQQPQQVEEEVEQKVEEVVEVKAKSKKEKAISKNALEEAMSLLGNVVATVVSQSKATEIENRIMDSVQDTVKAFIQKEYGTIERKIITVVDGKKAEVEGVQHEMFDTVLKFVANNEPVFLTGAAGCGKNVLCQQVAKALNLDFYFSNAVTQEYKITGFTDAMGVFHESQFYKAFKNGGLFMLDEMDASIPEVLVILNAAIVNRYFDFPAPIGYVEAHPDFRVIAAGNTFGLGANYEYVGRNQLDMASLDRFALVRVEYDRNIEMSVANGNEELVDFCDEFRKAAQRAGVRIIISYRAIGRIAKMEQLLGVEEALKTCLLKSLEVDDIQAIISNCDKVTKYSKAVATVRRKMSSEF